MNKVLICALLALGLIVSGCQKAPALKVGIIEGLGQDIMEQVQKEAAAKGLALEIITFKDYIAVNTALKQKKIDLNCFQGQYWLTKTNKELRTNLAAVGKTYLSPLGFYSQKHKNIFPGAAIAIPDDTISIARALAVLENAGYIKLKNTDSFLPGLLDIEQNSLNLLLTAVDAAKIRAVLPDYDVVCLGINYALSIGLQTKDALILEQTDSDFTQLIVTRDELKNHPDILRFVEIYNSEPIKSFILKKYAGNILPAW